MTIPDRTSSLHFEADPPPLKVRQMRVIWRDTFVVENPPPHFLETSGERLQSMASYVCDTHTERDSQTSVMQVMERASRNVARTGYDSVLRVQFNRFQIANLHPTLKRYSRGPDRLNERQIRNAATRADHDSAWVNVLPVLLLHKSGTGIMQYHVSITSEDGFTPEEAIALVRMGISPQILNIPDTWAEVFPDHEDNQSGDVRAKVLHGVTELLHYGEGHHITITGLRDISQHLIAAKLGRREEPQKRRLAISRRAKRAREVEEALRHVHNIERPTGSTSVMLIECDPMPADSFQEYVSVYARTLRGIGAMDAYYRERASWLIEQELFDNLSTDAEMAVYVLGNSELMLFNHQFQGILPLIQKRLGHRDDDLATIYEYMHYAVLLEWTYLQEAILRAYIQRLDRIAASGTPQRKLMVDALQGALADMVQYQENITPFANRVEFLERVGVAHKLDQLGNRFERKQQLLLTYASEWHDYQEARAANFLNFLAGILAAAELTSILAPVFGIDTGTNPGIYAAISFGTIGVVFIVLVAIMRRRG